MRDALQDERFAELVGTVNQALREAGWRGRHGVELLKFFGRLAVFFGGFALFTLPGVAWKIIGLPIMSYGYYAIAISGTHQARHGSFAETGRGNLLWAHVFADFWTNQSNDWWHHRHVVTHHLHTNDPERDPELFHYPWVGPWLYFFVVPFLIAPWLFAQSAWYLRNRPGKLGVYLILASAGWAFHIWLFALVLPLWPAVGMALLMRSLFAPVFMHIAVFNHVGLGAPGTSRPSWLPHQIWTTRNLKWNWFLSGLGGNAFVDCHVEHHLFPSVSNHMLWRLKARIAERAKEWGMDMTEEAYSTVLADGIRNYRAWFCEARPVLEGGPPRVESVE